MPSFSLFKSSGKSSEKAQGKAAEVMALLPRTEGLRIMAEAYLNDLSVPDLESFTAADLAATIQNLWDAGQDVPATGAGIKAYLPVAARHGFSKRHAVLDIVKRDMPFLIDSVTSALRDRGLNVHLVVHPTVDSQRTESGQLKSVTKTQGSDKRESWAQFFFDATSPEILAEIEAQMAAIMDDVQHAVADWQGMRAKLADCRTGLEHSHIASDEDKAEALAFLDWLDNNHFTFLGSRDYTLNSAAPESPLNYVAGSGLGVLHGNISHIVAGLNAMLPEVGRFTAASQLLLVTKTDAKATVHRAVPMDAVFVKLFDASGKIIGERLFVGLLTSLAYSRNARDIPLLRQKATRVLARAGLDPVSHNGKALVHILDTYPRDELFQVTEEELYNFATGIMQLQERQRVALFLRRDQFNRFVSCLVYIPREDFSTAVRQKIVNALEAAFDGTLDSFSVQLDQNPLMRLQVLIRSGSSVDPDIEKLEEQIVSICRSWSDRLKDAMTLAYGEADGLVKYHQYSQSFDTGYMDEVTPDAALADIRMLEQVQQTGELGVKLRLFEKDGKTICGLRLYHLNDAVHLSTTLPMIENMGLKVETEFGPFDVRLPNGTIVWIHDYQAPVTESLADLTARAHLVEEAFLCVWQGKIENDAFNRLVLGTGLTAREATLLRAFAKYLRQIRLPFTPETMAATLALHPLTARQLVQLFLVKFDPDQQTRDSVMQDLVDSLTTYIKAIPNLDEDRILSTYLNVLTAAVRTNYFQLREDGSHKPYLSIKFLSGQIEALPLPKPYAEIFVYSPQVEAVHLRGAKVARGGIRWSDRLEDFRTEVLGLMKAQMVKNAVIVPGGSKGGFVVKQPGSDFAADGIACYRTMMHGLLDITDNYTASGIVTPPRTVRHDGDDPYLVVAADKGTAKFSDTANEISVSYGFWLGDAFASGGSAGYDHKVMGITARGAWEAVKRHFREIGIDTQSQKFTTLGVGDMAGDVFGNGMLLSEQIELVAAFNYAHIFIDPTPDVATSFAERKRLFEIGRGSWDEYNAALISQGGGIFPRAQKVIPISPEMQQRFGITATELSPNELIQTLLRSQVDLIYFGGIGTYIKAEIESDLAVGDKANDALRVNAEEVRARVIGEGANLGITQRARTIMAARGVRLNTDAIDNSAGVDTSDHEVNIKILLADLIVQQKLDPAARDQLLARMTDDVAAHVLRDNYLQTQALSLAESRAADLLPLHRAMMHKLESIGLLNRALEFLPDEGELTRRASTHIGLVRPELAVLLAYSKIWLYDQLLQAPLTLEPALQSDLLGYFPPLLVADYAQALPQHRLGREIIATVVTNDIVNRLGLHAVQHLSVLTGATPEAVVRAYLIVRNAFRLPALWMQIEALDTIVPAKSQSLMLLASMRAVEQAMVALLGNSSRLQDLEAEIAYQADALQELTQYLAQNPADIEADATLLAVAESRLPDTLVQGLRLLGWLPLLPRLSIIARETGQPIGSTIPVFMRVEDRLQLRRLSRQLQQIAAETPFQAEALNLLSDDMLRVEQMLTSALIQSGSKDLETWLQTRGHDLTRYDELLGLIRSQPVPDFALWSLLSRELLTLAG